MALLVFQNAAFLGKELKSVGITKQFGVSNHKAVLE